MDIFDHRPHTSPGIILSHVVICIPLGYLHNLFLHTLYKNILWKLLHCREKITFKSTVSTVGSFILPEFDNIYILVHFKSFHWNSVLSPASATYYRLWQTLHISSQSKISQQDCCFCYLHEQSQLYSHSQKCKLPVCFKPLCQTQHLSFLALFHHSCNCSTCASSHFAFRFFICTQMTGGPARGIAVLGSQTFLEVWLFL